MYDRPSVANFVAIRMPDHLRLSRQTQVQAISEMLNGRTPPVSVQLKCFDDTLQCSCCMLPRPCKSFTIITLASRSAFSIGHSVPLLARLAFLECFFAFLELLFLRTEQLFRWSPLLRSSLPGFLGCGSPNGPTGWSYRWSYRTCRTIRDTCGTPLVKPFRFAKRKCFTNCRGLLLQVSRMVLQVL